MLVVQIQFNSVDVWNHPYNTQLSLTINRAVNPETVPSVAASNKAWLLSVSIRRERSQSPRPLCTKSLCSAYSHTKRDLSLQWDVWNTLLQPNPIWWEAGAQWSTDFRSWQVSSLLCARNSCCKSFCSSDGWWSSVFCSVPGHIRQPEERSFKSCVCIS